ncbi:MAG: flavin reductase [Flavobacteriaceae bacterium]|nr:flavin reductase [Flavobacteriaceae bacterium]
MELDKLAIAKLDRVPRLRLINALSGIKPANLIGTVSTSGQMNLAIISSVVHLGSDPALMAYICRPDTVPRHSLDNIKTTGSFTINHVHTDLIEKAHYTSAKFDRTVSEFDRCGLTPTFVEGIAAPFVAESRIRIGLALVEIMPIKHNGTFLVIGEINFIHVDDDLYSPNSEIDLSTFEGVGISGLNSYYGLTKLAEFPYARVDETPDFKREP